MLFHALRIQPVRKGRHCAVAAARQVILWNAAQTKLPRADSMFSLALLLQLWRLLLHAYTKSLTTSGVGYQRAWGPIFDDDLKTQMP